MRGAKLTCQVVVELLTDYLEGSMPPAAAARLARHLGRCPGCATYLEQLQLTIRLAGRLG